VVWGPVARGIDGRPRSAAQAAAWPGSLGATAASWRVVELLSFVACSSSERNTAGSTGRGGGGQRRACGQGAHGQAASGRAVAQRAHAGRA